MNLDLKRTGQRRIMKIFILMMFLVVTDLQVYGQCSNSISLEKVEVASENLKNGKIDIKISSNSAYEAQLYYFNGTSKTFVEIIKGRGSDILTFMGLSAIGNYEVLVIFNDEEESFCKKRKISEISTSIK